MVDDFIIDPEESLKGLQDRLGKWQRNVFNVTHESLPGMCNHFLEETSELVEAIYDIKKNGKTSLNVEQAKLELADCFLFVVAIADVLEIDLTKAVEMKMQMNLVRNWLAPDANGVIRHAKEARQSGNGSVRSLDH